MISDWRMFRPAIWTAMVGVALLLLVSPAVIGVAVVGMGLGIGLKIHNGRRRLR